MSPSFITPHAMSSNFEKTNLPSVFFVRVVSTAALHTARKSHLTRRTGFFRAVSINLFVCENDKFNNTFRFVPDEIIVYAYHS